MGYSCRYVQDFQNRTNESNRIKAGLGFTTFNKKPKTTVLNVFII